MKLNKYSKELIIRTVLTLIIFMPLIAISRKLTISNALILGGMGGIIIEKIIMLRRF